MSFKDVLYEKTKIKKDLLPSSYKKVGDVVLIHLKKEAERYKKEIAKAIKELTNASSVLLLKKIPKDDPLRRPNVEILVGKNTETVHKELGCLFKLDLSKVMFSTGNHGEKKRLIKLISSSGKKEEIIDMFSGIGYFSIPIAKNCKNVKKIYVIELNPDAFFYLNENIKLNKLDNVVAFLGDAKEVINSLPVVDRVLMGLLPEPKEFFEDAYNHTKKGGFIHYHMGAKSKEDAKRRYLEFKEHFPLELEKINKVKSLSSGFYHFVLDLKKI